jgi:ribosomal protein S25
MPDPKPPFSLKQVAEAFGVTKGAVQKWDKLGLNRSWTLQQIRDWRKAFEEPKGKPAKQKPAKKVRSSTPPPKVKNADQTPEQAVAPLMTLSEARTEKLRKEVERLNIMIARDRGELVSRAEVREAGIAVGALLSAEIAAMVNDLPGQLAGLDEVGIRAGLLARTDALLVAIKNKL